MPRISICGLRLQRLERAAGEVVLAAADLLRADGLLEREHEPGADRLDDRRRAALLADRGLGVVGLPGRADEQDRAAARHRRHPVGEQRALGHEHARRPRPADELVRGDAHGVLVGQVAVGDVRRRVHVDRQVGPRAGVVPQRQRAVAVQRDRDAVDVGDDPGHVGRGREGADLQCVVGVAGELVLEVLEVDPPLRVLADRHDLRARLPPRQLVGVVLVRADEDDRALEIEDADELVDRARRPRAAEHDDVLLAAVDRAMDDAPRVLAHRGRVQPGRRRLRVGVRVERQHAIADVVLDERQRAAGGRVVGVHEAARAERPVEHHVVADHRVADPLDQRRAGRRGRCGRSATARRAMAAVGDDAGEPLGEHDLPL